MGLHHTDVSRRQLAKGVAWAVPAVVVAGAAPAFAASNTTITGDSYVNFGTYYDRANVTNQFGCSFSTSAPDSVKDLRVIVWLPCPSLTFGPNTGTGGWTTLTRWNGSGTPPIPGATATIVAPTTTCRSSNGTTYTQTGCTYYAYVTTWPTGPAGAVTCGGTYNFDANGWPTSCTCHPTAAGQTGHYYWLQATVGGVIRTGGGLTAPRKINCP